jgi:hypothetical protein
MILNCLSTLIDFWTCSLFLSFHFFPHSLVVMFIFILWEREGSGEMKCMLSVYNT